MYLLIDKQPDFLVVAKNPGVHVHGQGTQAGLVAKIREDRGEEVFLVHRLDTPTSGLILLARHREAASELGGHFSERRVKKAYVALSDRKPNKKQGWVRGGMVKSRRGAWKLTRTKENEAQTHFLSASAEPGLRAFLLRPQSGRTHQLRVALKSVGAPILGDSLYGGTKADRCYLHAFALRFPFGDREFSYESPPRHGDHFASAGCASLLQRWSSALSEG